MGRGTKSDCVECQKRRGADGGTDLPRRGLLLAGVSGAAVLALPGCSGGQAGPGSQDSGPEEGGADAPDEAEAGPCEPTCAAGSSTFVLTFEEHPALKNVGGSVVVSPPGYSDPLCHNDFVIVVQPAAGEFVALSASCPHECCQVTWESSHGEFHCPCHGSTFSPTGKVTNGPAAVDLPALAVCADECGVTVTLP